VPSRWRSRSSRAEAGIDGSSSGNPNRVTLNVSTSWANLAKGFAFNVPPDIADSNGYPTSTPPANIGSNPPWVPSYTGQVVWKWQGRAWKAVHELRRNPRVQCLSAVSACRSPPENCVWININDLIACAMCLAKLIDGLLATLPRIIVIHDDQAARRNLVIEVVRGVHRRLIEVPFIRKTEIVLIGAVGSVSLTPPKMGRVHHALGTYMRASPFTEERIIWVFSMIKPKRHKPRLAGNELINVSSS
jgi:hypothetical protein